MALSRCLESNSPPRGNNYVGYVQPVGYPNSSTICASEKCRHEGVVWLKDHERKSYLNGERIFSYATNTAGVRVDDSGIKQLPKSSGGENMNFEEIWLRIVEHANETFHTITNLPFTYKVVDNNVLPYRNVKFVGRKLPRNSFQLVNDSGPYPGPGAINKATQCASVQGPAFVWAILNDKRIIG